MTSSSQRDSRPDSRLAYDDSATVVELQRDARLCAAAVRATRPAPSIHFTDYPREVAKPQIAISEAAQRLANALHLHLD